MFRKQHLISLVLALGSLITVVAQQTIPLDGSWDFRLDPEGVGLSERWFMEELPKVTIHRLLLLPE